MSKLGKKLISTLKEAKKKGTVALKTSPSILFEERTLDSNFVKGTPRGTPKHF